MKLRFLDPKHRLSVDTLAIARRLKIVEAIELGSGRSSALIVVADGSPDNRVLLVLAHILNGTSIVDVAFPAHKHVAVLEYLTSYALMSYTKILVLLDQEDKPLEEIYRALRSKAHVKELGQGKLSTFTLETALRTSTLILAVNGIDDPRFIKHTIEDHLIALAEKLALISPLTAPIDPKEAWHRVNRDVQLKVLRQLLMRPQLAEEMFPQQVKALKLLVGKSPPSTR